MGLYEISEAAEEDWRSIVNYTFEQFGEVQVRKYMSQLKTCTEILAKGEPPFKNVDDLYPSMRLKHCQHHYIFGLMRDQRPMLVVAILHERMDLMKQLKKRLNY